MVKLSTSLISPRVHEKRPGTLALLGGGRGTRPFEGLVFLGLSEGRAPCAGQVTNKGIVFPGALGTGPRGRPGPSFTGGWFSHPSSCCCFSTGAALRPPVSFQHPGTGPAQAAPSSQGTHRTPRAVVATPTTPHRHPPPCPHRSFQTCVYTVIFGALSV